MAKEAQKNEKFLVNQESVWKIHQEVKSRSPKWTAVPAGFIPDTTRENVLYFTYSWVFPDKSVAQLILVETKWALAKAESILGTFSSTSELITLIQFLNK